MPLSKEADKLAPVALAIVSLAIIVGVGSIVLTQFKPVTYVEYQVDNEVSTPATPFPTNYTVAKASNKDFEKIKEGSTTVTFYDKSANTNTTLEAGDDYKVYNDAGKFEYLNTTETDDYNSSEDKLYNDYTWEASETSTSIITTGVDSLQTFADFFTVIVVIAVAAVLFVMLRVVRGTGRSVGA